MSILIYWAQVGLYGLLMWAIYCGVFKGRPWHTGSRCYLLLGAVLPLVLPLVHVPLSPLSAAYNIPLPRVPAPAAERPASTLSLSGGVAVIWAIGTLMAAACYAIAYVRLLRRLHHGQATRFPGYRLLTHTGIGPGTIGTTVFFPGEATEDAILRHELAHIRAGHRFDLVLLQLLHVFFWMSPALWLIGRELKMVHEFEADARVLRHTDASSYTALMLSRALGIDQVPVAHLFFHHPLKRRILMLHKMKSSRTTPSTLFFALSLTAALCGGVLLAQTDQKKAPADKAADRPAADSTIRKTEEPMRILPDGRVIFSTDRLHKWPKDGKNDEGC